MLRILTVITLIVSSGCSIFPEIAHRPTVHNPFPQLSKVAVAPFFNLSNEPTVDGRQVAIAYYNELQLVPGFEVVPVNVVERAMQEYRISLSGAEDARRLAQILEVDAVVVGAITDFSPWYPPRCSMQVEWYAANPCFHPVPPGYGLPWGTPEEEEIPPALVFEAEMALAKEQLKTQTPPLQPLPREVKSLPLPQGKPLPENSEAAPAWQQPTAGHGVQPLAHQSVSNQPPSPDPTVPPPGIPPNWPDPRGFTPSPPRRQPPTCWPSDAPVLRHTRTYNGNDMDFTEALASYYAFRDEARFGGWPGYLQRSDDFTRFCCHMHISEMLSARGGAGETRVVWRWPSVR